MSKQSFVQHVEEVNIKTESEEFVLKRPVDFVLDLQNDFRDCRLAGLDVQHTVKCHSYRGLFDLSPQVKECARLVSDIKEACIHECDTRARTVIFILFFLYSQSR